MFSLLDFRQYFDGEQLDGSVCLGERNGEEGKTFSYFPATLQVPSLLWFDDDFYLFVLGLV